MEREHGRIGDADRAAGLLPEPVAQSQRSSIACALTDPLEQLIAGALDAAGIAYVTDFGGGNPSGLDFCLPNEGVEIEVKRMHTPRIAEQMARAENVIVAQGPKAVALLAAIIRRGM